MSNINNQVTSLDNAMFGIEDLSCNAAANVQGGAAMTLYRHANLQGDVLGSFNGGGLRSLSSNANDQISSVRITEGKWQFFSESNWINVPFKKDTVTLGPGTRNFVRLNDKISSFRRVG
jgi:Beta/Gamma crystallin